MQTKSFNIPASKKSAVETQLAKFNKRALKLEIDPLTWVWGKAFLDTVEYAFKSNLDSDISYRQEEVLKLPIEVSGPLDVTFDGWTFVVTLQHLSSGENVIRSLVKDFKVPLKYRTSGSFCDHCETKRYRKDTYLLSHTNGDMIQVGSSCIKSFLGENSPADILSKASLISELVSFMEGTGTGGAGGDIVFPIADFLAQTAAVIRDHGWVSKAKSYVEKTESTTSRVLDNLLPSHNPPAGFVPSKIFKDEEDLAFKVVSWIEDITDNECKDSDYLFNIRAIARSGMVGMRTSGFAASMLSAYNRFIKSITPDITNIRSQHIGNVKERKLFVLTLKFDFSFTSAFGENHRYVFNDDDGNIMVWKASKDYGLEVKKKYDIKGTIKEHSVYREVPQTILTRCEVLGEVI